ncbi:hypothetical protein GUJ93_ZPchr0006g45935 [Zizania palustris]|uniref:Kinetochore protein Nuf2 N-terminal domain-containing protein n=1 Tax=Zizania palustris TaxID=103762 RepID=A0A8J5SV02_ZIZPA|nr:hypothetical protein GUJ93_ZPchr0006g45935 [Zizania palustris]
MEEVQSMLDCSSVRQRGVGVLCLRCGRPPPGKSQRLVLRIFSSRVDPPLPHSSGVPLVGNDPAPPRGHLGFDTLAALNNPEHHVEAIQILRLYCNARTFLESVQFPGFTLRDLRPDPRRAIHILSALINFLYFREEKLSLLQPMVNELSNSDEHRMDLKAKIDEISEADFELVKLAQEKSKLLSTIVQSPEKTQIV